MYKTSFQKNCLTFPSTLIYSKIHIRRLDSPDHHEAKVYNYTSGKLHLKTKVFFEPGDHIYLHFDPPLPESKGFDLSAMSYGLVISCKEVISKSGFQFDLNTKWGFETCNWCNAVTRIDELHLTPELLFLCPLCRHRLENMPGNRIKQSINRLFLGNVI